MIFVLGSGTGFPVASYADRSSIARMAMLDPGEAPSGFICSKSPSIIECLLLGSDGYQSYHIIGVVQMLSELSRQEPQTFDIGAFFGQPFEAQFYWSISQVQT
jgi:hypothetical protein